MEAQDLLALIRERRSVFPEQYNDVPVSKAEIEQILEAAQWAPTHKRTEPWRFKVVRGAGLARLADYMGEFYAKQTPADAFSPMQQKKLRQKALRSAAVIAICLRRDPEARLPEWEELAAVSAAVQNMWLMAHALGIGAYWGTGKPAMHSGEWLGLPEGEQCLGFFFMGRYAPGSLPAGQRSGMADKVEWVED